MCMYMYYAHVHPTLTCIHTHPLQVVIGDNSGILTCFGVRKGDPTVSYFYPYPVCVY